MSGGISATTMVMMAATAVSAVAGLYAADSADKSADAGAELQRREGAQQADAAMAQAEKIRKAGRAQAGAANAAMAASGVAIGEGTPLRINEAIYQDSESDAYSTLLTGTRRQRSSEEQAGIMESEGKAAKTGGYLSATASVLSAGSSYSKWQTTQKRGG
jgi:hypothetical protein